MEAHDRHNWYLLQCKPMQDRRAAENLDNQSFCCFLPTRAVQRRRRGRLCAVSEPLFPGYLFIRLGPETNWRALRATRGVSRVVAFNGTALPVEESIVDALRLRCAENRDQPEPLFQPGQQVTITEGCFRNIEAIVQTVRAEDRVVLLLNLIQRQTAIDLPVASVSPVLASRG